MNSPHFKKIKYPRTKHLPWSPGVTGDDLRLSSINFFKEKEIVVTEKLDGENTTLYKSTLHARSLDTLPSHPSTSWMKAFHGSISHQIPEGWRICGENMYAKHAIHYLGLESYFYIFSIWNEENICLSWDETSKWAKSLGVATPKTFYRGILNESLIQRISINPKTCEGYVVRPTHPFPFSEFGNCVAKYVRQGHVQAGEKHWKERVVIPNRLS